MQQRERVESAKFLTPGSLIAVVILISAISSQTMAQGWPGYGHDAQHSNLAVRASQIPQKIRWSTAVDLVPPYSGNGDLYIHYGTPVITRFNTVLVPVKTTGAGDYRVEAHRGSDGSLLWMSPASGFTLPSHGWVPIFGITLTPKDGHLAYPGPGGTVFVRTFPDSPKGSTSQIAFFGNANYQANVDAYNSAIQICTPISSDKLGNLSFGYVSSGAALPGYPSGIPSGLARISNTGVGSFVSAVALSGGDANIQKVAYNCAPSFSADGSTLYVAVNNGSTGLGYLCAADSTTLVFKSSILCLDPRSTSTNLLNAFIDDDGSATPTVGPDGDVYFGVLGNGISANNYRGFLLHFNSTLTTRKLSSAFGWDDTASVVPASAVPSYHGTSTYLLLTKYNNYAGGAGGDGVNKLAVVDPNTSFVDPISGVTTMMPVITVTGVTPDTAFRPTWPNAVREWCINSAAIDQVNKCAVVNSEDGHVYRWDFTTNTLSPGLMLEPPTGEAYTPTVIGADGAVYAINNAKLFCCVKN